MKRQSLDSLMIQFAEKRARTEDSRPHEEELLKDFSSSDIDKEITVRLDENEEDEGKDDLSDLQTAKVMRALGNRDVLEHLASFLDYQDLGSFYETCQTVKTNMDELSLWRKRAQKLAKNLGIRKSIMNEGRRKKRFNCKSEESSHFRKLCYSLIKDAKGQVERLFWISSRAQISKAAYLAHNRMLGSVKNIVLKDMDLASIPAGHLEALASCVTGGVEISNVSNCDIVSILDSVKSEWLSISSQTLRSDETQALVQAMESRVEIVILGDRGEVTLDMMALTQYNGHGKCEWVRCYEDTANRYREEVRSWAQRINWHVSDNGRAKSLRKPQPYE